MTFLFMDHAAANNRGLYLFIVPRIDWKFEGILRQHNKVGQFAGPRRSFAILLKPHMGRVIRAQANGFHYIETLLRAK